MPIISTHLIEGRSARLSSLCLAATLLLFCANSLASSTPATEAPAPVGAAVSPPGVDPAALKLFVHNYWQQRFKQHAERVNWRDYQWQIEITVPEAIGKLPPCQQPYQAEDSQSKLPIGRQPLRVRCPDSPGWMVTTRSQISVLMPVLVTRTALSPEHYLQASDLAVTQTLLTAHQDDVLIDPAQAIGRQPLRPLRAGQPVRNKMLAAALLVRKGDNVRLTMNDGTMSISMEGTALQNGQRGEIISVKNGTSGKIISASVTGPGQLLIQTESVVEDPDK